MYEGSVTMVCKDIVEENWIEYLKFVKQRSDDELERQKKRVEALAGLEDVGPSLGNTLAVQKADYGENRYYDLSLNGFWNWYIGNKLQG